MMLALGMELRLEDFARLTRMPKAVGIGVAGQLLLLPCAALAVVAVLPVGAVIGVGLVLLAACPGGATSNMFTRYARGNVALSISLTAVSSVIAPVSVPLIVGLGLDRVGASDLGVRVAPWEMFTTLAVTTALPVAVGMSVLRWFPAAAMNLRGKLLGFATGVLVLLLVGLGVNTARAQPDLAGMFARSAFAVLLLMGGCATVALLLSRLVRLGRPEERTLVLEIGVQNINLALVVALNFLGEPKYLGPTLVYLPMMLLLGVAVVVWGRRADGTTRVR
jgi:BASS family bile acid:Na+ symporter